MKIAGIDPGFGITGYGIIHSSTGIYSVIEAGVVRSRKSMTMDEKLENLYCSVTSLFKEYKPDAVSVEEVYSHYRHPKTAVIMGHARGVILLSAKMCNIPIYQYSATRIKKASTGNGRATKNQVQFMIKKILGVDTLEYPEDVSDALAAALCHAYVVEHS